jgi:hypothetical protein
MAATTGQSVYFFIRPYAKILFSQILETWWNVLAVTKFTFLCRTEMYDDNYNMALSKLGPHRDMNTNCLFSEITTCLDPTMALNNQLII